MSGKYGYRPFTKRNYFFDTAAAMYHKYRGTGPHPPSGKPAAKRPRVSGAKPRSRNRTTASLAEIKTLKQHHQVAEDGTVDNSVLIPSSTTSQP